jgi:hypothetical protein
MRGIEMGAPCRWKVLTTLALICVSGVAYTESATDVLASLREAFQHCVHSGRDAAPQRANSFGGSGTAGL